MNSYQFCSMLFQLVLSICRLISLFYDCLQHSNRAIILFIIICFIITLHRIALYSIAFTTLVLDTGIIL